LADTKSICVRFNLDNPVHKKAYDYLKSNSEFSSNSSAIVTAVAEYFDSREREDRIIGRITAVFEKCLAEKCLAEKFLNAELSPPAEVKSADETVSDEIDFDFLGG